MMKFNPFARLAEKWNDATISTKAVGKYIILTASALHLLWAGLMLFDSKSAKSTPLAIIEHLAGGNERAAVVLIAVAVTAMFYPFVRKVGRHAFALMLIPQQTMLLLSAGAGLHATIEGQYADGVERGWTFILGDQSPMMALAILYTVAVLYAAWDDDRIVSYT
jgi:hypothetical protein